MPIQEEPTDLSQLTRRVVQVLRAWAGVRWGEQALPSEARSAASSLPLAEALRLLEVPGAGLGPIVRVVEALRAQVALEREVLGERDDVAQHPPSMRALGDALVRLAWARQATHADDEAARSALEALEIHLILPPETEEDRREVASALGLLVPLLHRFDEGLAREVARHSMEPSSTQSPRLRALAEQPIEQPASMNQLEEVMDMAEQLSEAGRHSEALLVGGAAVVAMRSRLSHSPDDERRFARRLTDWSKILRAAGRLDEEEAALIECVQRLRNWSDPARGHAKLPDPAYRAAWLVILACHLTERGRPAEATPWIQEALEVTRAFAEHDPTHRGELVKTLIFHGQHLTQIGRHHEAIQVFGEALALQRVLSQEAQDDGALVKSLFNLLVAQMSLRDHAAMAPVLAELVPLRHRMAAEDPGQAELLLNELKLRGLALRTTNDLVGSLAAFEEALAIHRSRGRDLPQLVDALYRVGGAHFLLGHPEAARPFYEEALALHGECEPRTAVPRWYLTFEAGSMYRRLEAFDAALAHFEESLAVAESARQRAESARGCSLVLSDLNRHAEARRTMAEAIDFFWIAAQDEPDMVDPLREAMLDYLEIEPNPSAEVLARAHMLGVRK